MTAPSLHIAVTDPSQVAEARRLASARAAEIGLTPDRSSDVAIVITELATNLLKHAAGGSLIIRQSGRELEIIAIDRGPGIENLQRCLEDGYSTAGSAGTGLGAVSRIASQFDAYSAPTGGAAVYARLGPERGRAAPDPSSAFQHAGLNIPAPGETECGDAYQVIERDGGCSVLVADGLGHGPHAAAAAQAALTIFTQRPADSAPDLIASIHAGLRNTRGAAIAVAVIDPRRQLVHYCGLGNIVGAVAGDAGTRRMVSQNGTAGQGAPRINHFTYPWDRESVLLMHSDGIQTRWDLDRYPGIRARHPALLAAVLYRDFARGRDDATALAVRRRAS